MPRPGICYELNKRGEWPPGAGCTAQQWIAWGSRQMRPDKRPSLSLLPSPVQAGKTAHPTQALLDSMELSP